MTRKDFILIAAAIRAARDEMFAKEPDESHVDLNDGLNYTAEFIADALRRTNERFDRERFLKACGVQS